MTRAVTRSISAPTLSNALVPLSGALARDLSQALVQVVGMKEQTRRVVRRAELEVEQAAELRRLITGLARERTVRVEALARVMPFVDRDVQLRLMAALEQILGTEADDIARLVSRSSSRRLSKTGVR